MSVHGGRILNFTVCTCICQAQSSDNAQSEITHAILRSRKLLAQSKFAHAILELRIGGAAQSTDFARYSDFISLQTLWIGLNYNIFGQIAK